MKTACLNFKKSGAMNAGQFKSVVYGECAPEQVTVIIDRLPGIGGVGEMCVGEMSPKPTRLTHSGVRYNPGF